MLRGLVVALAIAVGVFVYLAVGGGDDEEEPASAPAAAEARIVSAEELAEIATEAGQPVYWAGEMEGTELEVAEDETGVLVRYLREDDGSAPRCPAGSRSAATPSPTRAKR